MQYLNYRMLKKQLGLLESYLEDTNTAAESMVWLKLLFQRTLDGEISKLVDFYSMQVAELTARMDELSHNEKELVLSILNVRLHVAHSAVSLCGYDATTCSRSCRGVDRAPAASSCTGGHCANHPRRLCR